MVEILLALWVSVMGLIYEDLLELLMIGLQNTETSFGLFWFSRGLSRLCQNLDGSEDMGQFSLFCLDFFILIIKQ